MAVINHSTLSGGALHAVHNLEYPTATDREAGTNEANGIVAGATNLYQVARQTSDDTFWVLVDTGPLLWVKLVTADVVTFGSQDWQRITVANGGVQVQQVAPVELVDDGYITLPSETYGFGRFCVSSATAGGAAEWGEIAWSTTGVPEFVNNSANAVLTDTDTKLCFFQNSTSVRVRNRLGSTKLMVFEFFYGQGS